MGFIDHYSNFSNFINSDDTGVEVIVDVYGHNSDAYLLGELNVINFWVKDRLFESLDTNTVRIGLYNPLVLIREDYDITDQSFAIECVGYAVSNNYDSVVIESSKSTYIITIDFDTYQRSLNTFLIEDNLPLSGKKISKERRKEIARRKHANKSKNKPKPGMIKRPAKSPPKGIKIEVLLSNTGRLSPRRVDNAMKYIHRTTPKITRAMEIQDVKYFRAEYNFKSKGSTKTQMGYADISQDKEYCSELFCSCSDFFYRLYAPYVAAGLSSWNVPSKYKTKQLSTVVRAPHNHHWTKLSNPEGKLFLCKHLWAFLAYYVTGSVGNAQLSDEEIDNIISQYFTDIDGDGEVEDVSTEFKKAFGKLYQANAGEAFFDDENDDKVEDEDNDVK